MKKFYFTFGGFVLVFLNFSAEAQCPPITVNAIASPTVFCAGNTSQLSAEAGVTGGGYSAVQIPFASDSTSGIPVTLSDDAISAFLPIGFNFTFFGNTYSQFNICSNGFISFSTNGSPYTTMPLPSTLIPLNMIAGAWQDLNPAAGGSVTYYTSGIAPYQKLVVSFVNVPHYATTNLVSMQFMLYETTNIIEIHSAAVPAETTNMLEGIQNVTGTAALAVPGRNSTLWLAVNDAWRFFPGNPNYTYSWSPSLGLSNDTIINPVASPVHSTVYTVTVTDSAGCTGTASVSLTITNPTIIINASPDTVCAGSISQLNATVFSNSTSNYTTYPIAYSPEAGSGTSVNLNDDQVSAMLPIGFNFSFYGNYYTQFNISSNGFVTFDSAAYSNNYQGCCSGQLLPNATNPNNLIAAAWEDYKPNSTSINYFTTGVFPNEKLVVNFINLPHSPMRDSVTTQIILYETTNIIEIHTSAMPGNPHGFWFGHTMGIENATGTMAVTVPGRNGNNTWTATNDAWRFMPYVPYSYLWSPASSLSADSVNNPLASPAGNTIYTLTAIDVFGCTGIDSISVYTYPLAAVPTISVSGDTVTSSAASGNQWYLNGVLIPGAVNQTYIITQGGSYTVVCTNANGCKAESAPFTYVGIDELKIESSKLKVYPNPASSDFIFSYHFSSSNSTLYIYDTKGKKVFEKMINSQIGEEFIDITSLANGVYYLEAEDQRIKLVVIK